VAQVEKPVIKVKQSSRWRYIIVYRLGSEGESYESLLKMVGSENRLIAETAHFNTGGSLVSLPDPVRTAGVAAAAGCQAGPSVFFNWGG